jgi:predicted 2-oxoglutarate/Fe(II)-dependent dioxygenase YbiX
LNPLEVSIGIYKIRLLSPETSGELVSRAMMCDGWKLGTVQRGTTSLIIDPSVRIAEVLNERLCQGIYAELSDCMKPIHPLATAMAGGAIRPSPGQLIRYFAGGFYRAHRDKGDEDGGSKTSAGLRSVTVLLYLNDNYEGGVLEFPELSFTFTPEAGCALVFPATYLHMALPIVTGCKMAYLMWYLWS